MLNDINYLLIISINIFLYLIFHTNNKRTFFLYIIIKNFFFTLVAVLLTMKIQIKNDFLKFVSSHSYSIYLLQRIIFIYFSEKGILNDYPFIRFFFQFSLVVLISCIFDKYTIYIDLFLKKCMNKKNNKNGNKILVVDYLKNNELTKLIEIS